MPSCSSLQLELGPPPMAPLGIVSDGENTSITNSTQYQSVNSLTHTQKCCTDLLSVSESAVLLLPYLSSIISIGHFSVNATEFFFFAALKTCLLPLCSFYRWQSLQLVMYHWGALWPLNFSHKWQNISGPMNFRSYIANAVFQTENMHAWRQNCYQ